MPRFRIPEVIVGCLLTVAVFAMGMTIGPINSNPSYHQSAEKSTSGYQTHTEPSTFWNWIAHDASGFFAT